MPMALPNYVGVLSQVSRRAATHLTAIANNTNLPTQNYTTGANYVHNSKTTHYSPGGGTGIRLAFCNWGFLTNGTIPGYYDFNIRAAIIYKGVYYQVTFGDFMVPSSTDKTTGYVPRNYGTIVSDVVMNGSSPLIIDPGSLFKVVNQRVASDGGAAGSYNAIFNQAGANFRLDGGSYGQNTAIDASTGAGIITEAIMGPVTPALINTANGGLLNSQTLVSGGVGYTAAPSLVPFYGAAGAGNPGALIPGSGVTGYGNLTSGVVTSTTVSGQGTGHSAANPPLLFLDGGDSFGNTYCYGPNAIMGRSLTGTPGILYTGDSITAGFTSVDASGDENGSWGWAEQALAQRYGFHKFASSGTSAQGLLQNKTQLLAFISLLASYGYSPEYFGNAMSGNDWLGQTTTTASGMQSLNNSINKQFGDLLPAKPKIIAVTTLPIAKSAATSNRWTTVAEQSPVNDNFVTGGPVDQYNDDIRNNGGGTIRDYYLDPNIVARDPTSTYAWRIDAYANSGPNQTPACAYPNANDGSTTVNGTTYVFGSHPQASVGIPHLKANLTIPKLPGRPYVNIGAIATQKASIGAAFSYGLSAGTFTDPNGTALTYSAKLADGTALPSWLSFNAASQTLSGTPVWTNRAQLAVRIYATNTAGFSNYVTIPITVDSGLAFISKIYVRADNLNQLTVDGSNLVSKWTDASGNGFDLTQATALRQPKYVANVVDGHGAVRGRWDGSNASQLAHIDHGILKYTTFAAFVVFRRWADMNAVELIAGKFAASYREFFQQISAADYGTSYLSSNATGSTNSILPNSGFGALALNTTYVMETGYDGTNNYVAINGNTILTSAFAGPLYNGQSSYFMFSDDTTFTYPSAVDVFEHAFIPGGITAAQRTAILARIFAEFPSISHPATY